MGMVGAIAKDVYSVKKISYLEMGEDEEVPQEIVFVV